MAGGAQSRERSGLTRRLSGFRSVPCTVPNTDPTPSYLVRFHLLTDEKTGRDHDDVGLFSYHAAFYKPPSPVQIRPSTSSGRAEPAEARAAPPIPGPHLDLLPVAVLEACTTAALHARDGFQPRRRRQFSLRTESDGMHELSGLVGVSCPGCAYSVAPFSFRRTSTASFAIPNGTCADGSLSAVPSMCIAWSSKKMCGRNISSTFTFSIPPKKNTSST